MTTRPIAVDVALYLADLGYRVFPVTIQYRDDGRKNTHFHVSWERAALVPTTPGMIRTWWRQHPGAWPAIACGPSGIVVLDCDRHGGPDGVAEYLTAAGGEIPAYTLPTTTRGEHHFFTADPDRPIRPAQGDTSVLPGVDVRGVGGCIFLHPCAWPAALTLPAPDDLDPAPYWVHEWHSERERARERVQAPVTAAPDRERVFTRDQAAAYLARHARAPLAECGQGTINATLNAAAVVAGHFVPGYWSASDATECLIAAQRDAWLRHGGADDGDYSAAHATIASGLRHGAAEPYTIREAPAVTTVPVPTGIRSALDTGQDDPESTSTDLTDSLTAIGEALSADGVTGAVRAVREAVTTHWAGADLAERAGFTDTVVTVLRILGRRELSRLIKQVEADIRSAEADAERTRAEAEGRCFPSPREPLRVARELVSALPVADGVPSLIRWRGDWYTYRPDLGRWGITSAEDFRSSLYRRLEYSVYETEDRKSGERKMLPWNPTRKTVADLSEALASCVSRSSAIEADRIIACRNGVVDLGTRELLPHTPRNFNTSSLPYGYDPGADCPRWIEFLNQTFGGQGETFLAESLRETQQWFGYVISGRTDQQKIMLMLGPPRTGKGTLLRVLTALIGRENVTSPTLSGLLGTFGEQSLIGRTLGIFSDVKWSLRDVGVGIEKLKAISGEDTRTVARKNREAWEGTLPTRFMMVSNDEPSFIDDSGAMVSRFLVLRFNRQVLGREDPGLTDALLSELPGILNWALDGLADLESEGRFYDPAYMASERQDLRASTSIIGEFLDERVSAGPAPDVRIRVDQVYEAYRAWSEAAGVRQPLTRRRFLADVRTARPDVRKIRAKVDGELCYVLCGLAELYPGALTVRRFGV